MEINNFNRATEIRNRINLLNDFIKAYKEGHIFIPQYCNNLNTIAMGGTTTLMAPKDYGNMLIELRKTNTLIVISKMEQEVKLLEDEFLKL